MARKTKAEKEADAKLLERAQELADKNAASAEARKEQMGLLREIDALLWQTVDAVSRSVFKLITLGANDIASYRVRGRIATAITISYDDGYTYHVERRLGGLATRPVILEFEHSDPGHVGTVTSAIRFRTGGGPAEYEPEEESE